ncbi:MAG: hypothetical protein ACR2HX_12480 [Pyrinomonadaceae bacterium]
MIENPYTVKLMPPPVSEAGFGKQLPQSKVIPERAKPIANAILNVRFLNKARSLSNFVET